MTKLYQQYTDTTGETAQEFYKTKIQEELDRIEAEKAEFGRRMKSPNKGTEAKDGSPYGDIRYADFEKFKPAGGGEK